MDCFLEELSVLQSLNEFEFFSFHALNHGLMFNTFLLLTHHFIFNLLLGAHLFLNKFSLFFLARFNLLTLNHLLQRVVLDVLLLFDNLHEITLFSLLHFYSINITLHLFFEVTTSHIHILAVLLLNSAVLCLTEHLFLFLLSLSLLAFLMHLDVALSSQ